MRRYLRKLIYRALVLLGVAAFAVSIPAFADQARKVKPGPAVELIGQHVFVAQAGELIELTLPLRVHHFPAQTLVLEIEADEGVQLVSPAIQTRTLNNSDTRLTVQLKASQNGRYYVTLRPQMHSEAEAVAARPLSFALQVGPKAQAMQKTSGGVKSFAAQETIEAR